MTFYYWINCFFTFSFLGYLLECIVLTFENRQFVYNRGFGHGPFCIIYGFGAVGAAVLLAPLSGSMITLYFGSMLMATAMELVTAKVMIRLFGGFWWDYSKKRFNYKGIVCLESSLGWGLLGIVFYHILNTSVQDAVLRVPGRMSRFLAVGLMTFYLADFFYSFRAERKGRENEDSEEEPVIGRMRVN